MTAPSYTSTPDTPWTFVFTDALTDNELAVLPATGVSYEKVLNGTGKATLFIPTADPAVRAMNPWAATVPRRCCVAIYYGDALEWYGMVWQRQRSQDKAGLLITAATLDSWLATQILNADITGADTDVITLVNQMIGQVQANPGGNFRMSVVDGSPAGTVLSARTRNFMRIDLKDPLTLLGTFLTAATPIEWRFDPVRNADGTITKQLVVGEPRLGRSTDVSGLTVWHEAGNADSTLLTFTDLDDGTVQANAAAGSIPDPNGTNQLTQRLWSYHTATEIGVDEVGAGFPLVVRGVSTMDRHVITQSDLDDAVLGAVADAMSQGKAMSNFTVKIDRPDVTGYDVGDDLDCEITHPAYEEWPAANVQSLRILGKKVTPRSPGGVGDKVELTVWDADSSRLPRSTTLVAHMRDLIRRVKSLETG